jgi:hypothetical protein
MSNRTDCAPQGKNVTIYLQSGATPAFLWMLSTNQAEPDPLKW